MNRRPLEGLILYGMKEVYELFRQSYVSKGKYRLPIWIGYNKSSKKEVTVIPLEQRDEQIKTDLISLFQNEERFRFIESRAKDGITFVFLDVLPSEFENIYLNLPVTSASKNVPKNNIDNSKVIIPVQIDKKHKQKEQSRLVPRVAWVGMFLMFIACGIGIYLTPNLFTQSPQTTNTNELVTTNSFAASPSAASTVTPITPTETNSIATATAALATPTTTLIVQTETPTLLSAETITPTMLPTETPIPTRVGKSGEIYLCPSAIINVFPGPSTATGPLIVDGKEVILKVDECIWFDAKISKDNRIWVRIGSDQTYAGNWVSSTYLYGEGKDSMPVMEVTLTPKPSTP